MPRLARWHIKSGLLYLAAALVIGVLLALQPIFDWTPSLFSLRPVMLHLFIVGWLTQIIFGVAYWMFPKRSKTQPRGSEPLGWWVYALLNIGLLLRAVGEPLAAMQPATHAGILLALSAIAQVASGWLFIANTWSRVKER